MKNGGARHSGEFRKEVGQGAEAANVTALSFNEAIFQAHTFFSSELECKL